VAVVGSPGDETVPKVAYENEAAYQSIAVAVEPVWYDRSDGWDGQAYLQAIQFCSSQESRVPCPYEAYCPLGKGETPLGGIKPEASWAPIFDGPNAWVQVGNDGSICELYAERYGYPPSWGLTGEDHADVTKYVMCCLEKPIDTVASGSAEAEATPEQSISSSGYELTEKEQGILNDWHPMWYERDDGYQGTTYNDAVEFCKESSGMTLCPLDAYCPHDYVVGEPSLLFLGTEAFDDEQWAPVSDAENSWVLVGTLYGTPATTCSTYKHLHGKSPAWGLDGSSIELKQHIMCCVDSTYSSVGSVASDENWDNYENVNSVTETDAQEESFDLEAAVMKDLQPSWYDWNGGSHGDAIEFCYNMEGRSLCPYAAYCPHGPGQPVIGGHTTDFNSEGEQWAPVYGHENHWVLISQKLGNSATTCLGHEELEGAPPDWGLTSDNVLGKRHIMCCNLKE
jgi:hypothetical protein